VGSRRGGGWLVRSTALLELRPELLGEVAVRFEDDAIGVGGRTAILDLLASTSGEAAQATLLKVLDGSTARQDEQRLAYLQRLMLVEEPSVEVGKTMRERIAKSESAGDAQMAYAEAHVLGAMAGRLAKRGEQAEAKASIDLLAAKVDGAQAPAARAAFVSALGNAGDASQISRISKHAGDADPGVRRAVASALRKTKDPAARGTLMTLAKDSNEDVQVAAIDALGHHPMERGDQRELASLLDAPQLGGEAEAGLVTILLRQGPPPPEVRGSLEHLLARTEDPRLAARVRFALESAN
jgi:HEAT repeat protein